MGRLHWMWWLFIRYGLYRCPTCWKRLRRPGVCSDHGKIENRFII